MPIKQNNFIFVNIYTCQGRAKRVVSVLPVHGTAAKALYQQTATGITAVWFIQATFAFDLLII
jgi:hypothetical protein